MLLSSPGPLRGALGHFCLAGSSKFTQHSNVQRVLMGGIGSHWLPMVAKGFIAMHHVVSKSNVADIVTKHWGHSSVYNLLKPVFRHQGDTDKLYEDGSPEALAEQYDEPK